VTLERKIVVIYSVVWFH